MKVVHLVGINASEAQKKILHRIGIEISSANSFTTLTLDEESVEYQTLRPYIIEWGLLDAVGTIFTQKEMDAAALLVVRDCWSNGYPMPDNDNGYKEITYKGDTYCSDCGTGLIQTNSFRLKKEPNWGNRHLFTVGWVYDELFVKIDLYENLFRKYGIGFRSVLSYRKGEIITDTVQLDIPTIDKPLLLDGYPFSICEKCGNKRYDLISRGFFPPFKGVVHDHLFKCQEYFGTGMNARKYIFLSAQIRKELMQYKDRINYIPCAPKRQ